MLQKILNYGVLAGLVVGVPLFAMTVAMRAHPAAPYGMVIGYTIMLIALSFVFVGIKRHRDLDRGGVISFWPAFGVGLAISVIAGIFYVVAWEAALAVSHLDFADGYAKALMAQQQAKGASAATLAKLSAEMQEFKVQYANPLYRVPMTFAEIFPVGVLVSWVSAGLLRNSRFLPALARQRSTQIPAPPI